jgi:hypothetical protein
MGGKIKISNIVTPTKLIKKTSPQMVNFAYYYQPIWKILAAFLTIGSFNTMAPSGHNSWQQ